MRYAALFVLMAIIMLTGCAQSSETVRHGATTFLLTET